MWYSNPALINVWDVRIVVEPQSQSVQDPHGSLRASSVPPSTCLSLFFSFLLLRDSKNICVIFFSGSFNSLNAFLNEISQINMQLFEKKTAQTENINE